MDVGATATGPCPREREKRLNSDFNKDKWEFITEDQCGDKNHRESIRNRFFVILSQRNSC